MYTISYSAASSVLISTCLRDFPLVSSAFSENYAFVMRNEEVLQDFIMMTVDQSTARNVYQQFVVTGSTISLPLGQYKYTLYNASASTQADINYNRVLENGFLHLIG